MKKVININFQGRVIPIEETAYDILKQYVESLRRYFANEESKEEIINDIESRIGELFAERLKKGSTCITDEDVNAVIASMGRPEDLEAEDVEINGNSGKQRQQQSSGSSQSSSSRGQQFNYATRGRLCRNEDDKIVAGVASGVANYLGIDPVIMRILFVLLAAPLFWVYIVLWIILPSTSVQSNITKRLYRSSDDRVIGGVAGGLAAYFNISAWVPRLIFALPLIIGLVSGPFNWWWHDWDFFWAPKVITGSLGTTLFVTYIILWIAVPVAVTSAEKLEMRGERVDLNSIRNTVKEDMESFKSRAQSFGNEVKETAQQFGERAKEFGRSASSQAKTFTAEAGVVSRRAGSGFGHAIGVLFKAFFLFFGGIAALVLFGLFIALLFSGFTIFPLKDFVLDGFWQNMLAWSTLFLFFGIPLLGLITWLVRRIIGVRSKNHYLGYIFGGLWIIGLISLIVLSGFVTRSFRSPGFVEQELTTINVNNDKLIVDVADNNIHYYGADWYGIEWSDWPFYGINEDTLMVNTVRVDILKSPDANYHVSTVRASLGRNPQDAQSRAEKINFSVVSRDSVLMLPTGFPISRDEKWRVQQVMVRIEVPVGKRILLDRSIDHYEWFDINFNRRGRYDYNRRWEDRYWVEKGVEYVMTPDGPKRVSQLDENELKKGRFVPKDDARDDRGDRDGNEDNDGYRYRRDSTTIEKKDSLKKVRSQSSKLDNSSNTEANGEEESGGTSPRSGSELSSPVTTLLRMFQ